MMLAVSAQGRLVIHTVVRTLCSVVLATALYYLLPLDRAADLFTVTFLVVGLVVLVTVMVWQVRGILRSPNPLLRAIEGLAVSIPFYLLLFSAVYFLMARASDGTFNEALTRTDALYFTVTVFATVGFGDIAATSQAARLIVTFQMLVNLVLIGAGLRIVVGAVRVARGRDAPSPTP
jgi:hypothetical protein